MSLEERSGPKTLLKLLLEKTNEVLDQSITNQTEIIKLRDDILTLRDLQTIMAFHLQQITGESFGPKDIGKQK